MKCPVNRIIFSAIVIVCALITIWFVKNDGAIKQYRQIRQDSTYNIREKKFHRTRLEVLSRFDACLHSGRYLKKYRDKWWNGDQQTMHYFDCQKARLFNYSKTLPDTNQLSIALVGDLMWIGKAPPDYVCPHVLSYLDSFDLVFGNLETPIDQTRSVPDYFADYFTYNSNPALVAAFISKKKARNHFTALTLANNHAFDKGSEGLLNTMALLDQLNIAHTGARLKGSNAGKYIVVEKKGVRIGLYAATYGHNSTKTIDAEMVQVNQLGLPTSNNAIADLEEINRVLNAMENEDLDFKVVSLHWGYEFELFPDPTIRKTALKIVQAGADLIIGHHPHVFQPAEVVYLNGYPVPGDSNTDIPCYVQLSDSSGRPRKALVLYSLGNFVTRMFTPMCRTGAIVSISLSHDKTRKTTDWNLLDMKFVYNKAPLFPGKNHKLMLYEEYSKKYWSDKSKTTQRRKEEAEFIINHLSKTESPRP